MEDLMTAKDVARELDRSIHTVRDYGRVEGLPFRKVGRSNTLVVPRSEFEEWRSRPEIQQMLYFGSLIRRDRTPRLATA